MCNYTGSNQTIFYRCMYNLQFDTLSKHENIYKQFFATVFD